MALETKIDLSVVASLTKTADLGGIPKDLLDFAKRIIYRTGTGAGQADKLWYDERTLAASATEDLDLTGTLVDNLGTTLTEARVKALIVVAAPKDPNATQNSNNVVLGNAAVNAWAALLGATGTATLRPGTLFAALAGEGDATGYAVTAGTGDLLKVANSGAGTPVTYQIIVIGASA